MWPCITAPRRWSESALVAALGQRSVVLVGMMGAGKSSIGRRLAQPARRAVRRCRHRDREGGRHVDPGNFQRTRRAVFPRRRDPRHRRLLEGGPQVLATGGGAFMNSGYPRGDPRQGRLGLAAGRPSMCCRAASSAAHDRPLLKSDDPVETLRRLIDERYPIYAEADITVESRDVAHEAIVEEIIAGLCSQPRHRRSVATRRERRHDRRRCAPFRRTDPGERRARRARL